MKDNISNTDEQGNRHGKQIFYWSNGNIKGIRNYHHGKWNGYRATFNRDNSIAYKLYCNMVKIIYTEAHWVNKQIKINI